MNLELSAPLLNFTLAAGLAFLLLVTLYALSQVTKRWVVWPLSWFFFGDRQRTIWYQFVRLPGTVIHECSHLAACLLLLVRVTDVRLFSSDPKDEFLGWVEHQQVDPIRSNLIALAPFLGGSLVLLLLSRFAFPAFYAADWFQGFHGPAPGGLPSLLGHIGQRVWDLLIHADYLDWQTWFFLYLVFSIGLSIAPSAQDFKALPGGLILTTVAIGSCYLLGLALNVDWSTVPIVADGLTLAAGMLMALNSVLAYSAALVLFSLLLLVPLAWLLGRLRG